MSARGNKSISGDNNVLYVIDGVPVGNSADRGGDGSGFGAGRASVKVSRISTPDDIESISVLTGPSAAALCRVLLMGLSLINTKKGAAGQLRVNYCFFCRDGPALHPAQVPEYLWPSGWSVHLSTIASLPDYKVRDSTTVV